MRLRTSSRSRECCLLPLACILLKMICWTRPDVVVVHAWSTSSPFVVGSAMETRARQSNRRSQAIAAAALTMKYPVLDDWKVLRNGRVQGTVQNHPSIPDGDIITTSPILQQQQAFRPRAIVTTASGSKYQLGQPEYKEIPQANGKQQQVKQQQQQQPRRVSVLELQRRARVEKDLNGEIVGNDQRQYILAGRSVKSTSGKSRIYKAYRSDDDGLPVEPPLLVKLSTNWEAIEREHDNYLRITKTGWLRGQFVSMIDFFPTASELTKKYRSQSALVMERGKIDLKRYIQNNGASALSAKELRSAAAAAAQCLQAVHLSGLVWTDMKTENFVVTKDGTVKGIDLESAMPVKDNPVDYSPEATPPEFAKAFLAGDGPYFCLEFNYDLWSFGMMLYELATGKSYWDGKSPMQITKTLAKDPKIASSKKLDKVRDPKLRDLISQCVQNDPKARPNIVQVLLHPYFLTTGLGPISF